MLAAEFIEAPDNLANPVERLERVELGIEPCHAVARAEQPEALFGERVEDVVLAGEVSVEGGRAVFDTLGDLADGHVAVALGHEELAGGIEDGPAHCLAISLLTF